MDYFGRDQRDYISFRFRESDSPDETHQNFYDDAETDGSFTNSNFHFNDEEFGRHRRTRSFGRLPGRNRYGEERIRKDSYQDDFFDWEDPRDRYPVEHGGFRNRWSDDIRSEASRESYAGKGPIGYSRSPERILEEASERLARDHQVDATDINLSLDHSILYLTGEAKSRYEKRRAEALVESISGVSDVMNQLSIRKSSVNHRISSLDHFQEGS